MAERVSFRSAPLRSAADWRLDGDALEGPQGACDLSRVQSVRFVETVIKRMRLRRLDLDGPDGRCRIAINSTEALPPEDPDRAAHRALCLAVAARLADRAPGLPVTVGEGSAYRFVMFGIGLAALLMGLAVGAGAFVTGFDMDELIAVAAPTVFLSLIGGLLMYGGNPWRKPPQIPVSSLPALIEALDAQPEAPGPPQAE